MRKFVFLISIVAMLLLIQPFLNADEPGVTMGDSGPMIGIPFSGQMDDTEVDVNICSLGHRTVTTFLNAWAHEDFKTMYAMIDASSKEGFPYEDAKFTFRFLEYKEYEISSIRKKGDNFDFMLSYGDWKMGNKETKKIIVDGKSFKIIMPSKSSPFKESLANYIN